MSMTTAQLSIGKSSLLIGCHSTCLVAHLVRCYVSLALNAAFFGHAPSAAARHAIIAFISLTVAAIFNLTSDMIVALLSVLT